MTKIEELKAKMEEVRKEMRKMGREGLSGALAPFWDKLPACLESISWQQYTDYFNDGDECTFSVHCDPDYGLLFNGIRSDEIRDEETSYAELRDALYTAENQRYTGRSYISYQSIKPLKDFSQSLESQEELLKEAIGDHVEVTSYRDGRVEVESYTNHD